MWQRTIPVLVAVGAPFGSHSRDTQAGASPRRPWLRGFWMSYFAGRAAPLGPVPAAAVTAMAYGFAPGMVARAIPDAWGFADPAAVPEQDGAAIALASCRTDPAGGAELGLLVEDRWQRQGIGTRMLGGLIQHVDQHGLRPLKARVLAEQRWILRVLRSYGTCHAVYTFNAFDVTLHRQPATSANEWR